MDFDTMDRDALRQPNGRNNRPRPRGIGGFNGENDRRRMLVINNEINLLKTQIGSLRLKSMISKRDILYFIIALVLASIFGSLSFITIMNLKGYQLKFRKNRLYFNNDSEALIN